MAKEEKRWAKLTRDEWEFVKELRLVRDGSDEPVHWFTVPGSEELSDTVAAMVETARGAAVQTYEGTLFSIVVKLAQDPFRRRHQHQFMLQAITEHAGPQDDSEYVIFYPPEQFS